VRRTIYPDTRIWNKLFEENVDPSHLALSLQRRGWELALSPHVMYELARSFRAKRASSQKKAVPLFSYLERFLEHPVAFVKQTPDLLREEIRVANRELPKIDPYYREVQRERMVQEIRSLAAGKLDPRFDALFEYRSSQVATYRAGAPERAAKWESWMKKNPDFSRDELTEMAFRQFRPQMMEAHISSVFELPPKHVRRLARKILSGPRFRFCHALVRGDIYLDWLQSQGRAIQRDVLDDCYHIENAAHCDVYATDESRQEPAANAILSVTDVRIHDKKEPLLKWLTTRAIQ